MKNNGIMVLGLILIVFGMFGILHNFEVVDVSWARMWPLFILVPGILFELGFFIGGRKEPGLLVPGGILLTYGLLFLFCASNNFQYMSLLWPMFLVGPALGLLQVYVFGGRDRSILIPVGILGTLSIIFLTANLTTYKIGGMIFPVMLMLIGAFIILGTSKNNKNAS